MDLIAQARQGAGVYYFSRPACPYCNALSGLLTNLGIPYRVIEVQEKDKKVVAAHTGWKTFPMLYIGNEFIGGYDSLNQLATFQRDILQQKLIANNINVQLEHSF
jgi:glutaredoxin 3